MAPKKGTRAYKEEYVYIHYGIDMNSLTVKSVWERRDGTLSSGGFSHYVMPGRRTDSELIIVFNMTEIQTIPVSMHAHGKIIQEGLEKIAAEKRAERDKAKDAGA